MFFELRQYRIKSQQRERWVKFMEEKIIPFHVSRGIVVVGSFISPEKEDLYIWIRRFESEEERARFAKEMAESDTWQKELLPQIGEMMDRSAMQVTRLEATPKSVLQ
jgi:hypothetical protein